MEGKLGLGSRRLSEKQTFSQAPRMLAGETLAAEH
jgi:hypothetical protein